MSEAEDAYAASAAALVASLLGAGAVNITVWYPETPWSWTSVYGRDPENTGYLLNPVFGATIYADFNGNDSPDLGEEVGVTDWAGRFELPDVNVKLFAKGGRYAADGTPFLYTLTAEPGSRVISWLTTILASLDAQGAADFTSKFGLPDADVIQSENLYDTISSQNLLHNPLIIGTAPALNLGGQNNVEAPVHASNSTSQTLNWATLLAEIEALAHQQNQTEMAEYATVDKSVTDAMSAAAVAAMAAINTSAATPLSELQEIRTEIWNMSNGAVAGLDTLLAGLPVAQQSDSEAAHMALQNILNDLQLASGILGPNGGDIRTVAGIIENRPLFADTLPQLSEKAAPQYVSYRHDTAAGENVTWFVQLIGSGGAGLSHLVGYADPDGTAHLLFNDAVSSGGLGGFLGSIAAQEGILPNLFIASGNREEISALGYDSVILANGPNGPVLRHDGHDLSSLFVSTTQVEMVGPGHDKPYSQALVNDDPVTGAVIVAFEDLNLHGGAYDGDYNDVVITLSHITLSANSIHSLALDLGL